MNRRQLIIAVFGGYQHEVGDAVYETAETLGRLIAESGWVVLNGGYGGSMEASARGAHKAGGRVIGVTCDVFSREVNAFTDETIATADLWQRIRVMLERSDGFAALPGATGTLAEVAMAWEFLVKGFMRPKPLILVGDFWRPLYRMLIPCSEARAEAKGMVQNAAGPAEAVDMLKALLEQ